MVPPLHTVAARMLSSFGSIRICLMVGIGSGVPSEGCDIRLGDVVVSKPGKTFGGVVQYDFKEGQFMRTGVLNKPPWMLLKAVATLQAEHELIGSKIPQLLAEMFKKYPRMQAAYSHQGSLNDRLYQPKYVHVGDDNTCESCNVNKATYREDRDTGVPFIHYGIIASGNQVIKDAFTRDRLKKGFDAICLEMEAAGLWDNLPCLVIRGICDYADSHKNKRWQRYAATTSAAYAKELLGMIPASEVDEAPAAVAVISIIRDKLTTIKEALKSDQEGVF